MILLLILLSQFVSKWSDVQRFVRSLFDQPFFAKGRKHFADRSSGNSQLHGNIDAAYAGRNF